MKRIGAAFGVVVCLLVGCAGSTSPEKTSNEKLHDELAAMQHLACRRPATTTCDPTLRVSFETRAPITLADGGTETRPYKANLWCEGGQPHGSFTNFEASDSDATGEFGESMWEAIWRVLDATHSCASVGRTPVVVTRGAQTVTCDEPHINMASLFEYAHWSMKVGRPNSAAPPEWGGSICDVDPTACVTVDVPMPCPPYAGDAWSAWSAEPRPDASAAPARPIAESQPEFEPALEGPPRKDIVAAMTRARRAARACVKGVSQSSVRITFLPDGTVGNVSVMFESAKRAEKCLAAALGTMHVSPFDPPAYTFTTTIR